MMSHARDVCVQIRGDCVGKVFSRSSLQVVNVSQYIRLGLPRCILKMRQYSGESDAFESLEKYGGPFDHLRSGLIQAFKIGVNRTLIKPLGNFITQLGTFFL